MFYQFAKVLVQIFIIVLLSAVYGQSQPPSPGLPDRESDNTFKAMKSRSSELERLRRVNTSPRENEPQLNLPLIYKDFNKIQLINTEKLQKNNAAGNLNFPAIAKASKDIKKRAMRLKSNLFPTSKNEDLKIELKEDFRVERLNGLIIALDNSIYRFVSNPLFKNLKLLETQDTQKAQDELRKIIVLSQTIELVTEKLQDK